MAKTLTIPRNSTNRCIHRVCEGLKWSVCPIMVEDHQFQSCFVHQRWATWPKINSYMKTHLITTKNMYIHTYIHACKHTYIHTYIHTYLLLLISMLWHRQAIFESKGDKLSSSAEGRIRTQRVSDTYSPADWMPADKPTELSRIKQKLELDSPSLWSASIQPTWPHCHLAFAPDSGDIHICPC